MKIKTKTKTISSFPQRGGSSLIEVDDKLIVFGGANREGTHFADMAVCYSVGSNCAQAAKSPSWKVVEAQGDVPNARSGHAVCSIGKYMLLHGGINYVEEVAYNDFYILDTETMIWKYIGETGEEISARNSHSLHVIPVKDHESLLCLTLYGGASPETGPLGDTYFAIVDPSNDTFGGSEFFVNWQKLAAEVPQVPVGREMHSSCVANGSVLIVGGRELSGALLSDAWVLAASCKCHGEASITSAESIDTTRTDIETEIYTGREAALTGIHSSSRKLDSSSFSLMSAAGGVTSAAYKSTVKVNVSWQRAPEFDLPVGRCAHGMAVVSAGRSVDKADAVTATAIEKSTTTTFDAVMESVLTTREESDSFNNSSLVSVFIFGGLTQNGISNELLINTNKIVNSSNSTSWGPTALPSIFRHTESNQTVNGWKQLNSGATRSEFHGRIGASMCTCPCWYQDNGKSPATKGRQVDEDSATGAGVQAVLIFGGVSAETDFNDVVRIQFRSSTNMTSR